MGFARRFERERGVSPVIGVVLVVAITVVLSAVIGTYVLDLGVSQDTVPQSSWKTEYSAGPPDELTLTHESGDAMEADRLYVVISGASGGNGKTGVDTLVSESAISASMSMDLNDATLGTSNLDLSSATVRLVWEDEDTGDQADSDTLLVWEGPDA